MSALADMTRRALEAEAKLAARIEQLEKLERELEAAEDRFMEQG